MNNCTSLFPALNAENASKGTHSQRDLCALQKHGLQPCGVLTTAAGIPTFLNTHQRLIGADFQTFLFMLRRALKKIYTPKNGAERTLGERQSQSTEDNEELSDDGLSSADRLFKKFAVKNHQLLKHIYTGQREEICSVFFQLLSHLFELRVELYSFFNAKLCCRAFGGKQLRRVQFFQNPNGNAFCALRKIEQTSAISQDKENIKHGQLCDFLSSHSNEKTTVVSPPSSSKNILAVERYHTRRPSELRKMSSCLPIDRSAGAEVSRAKELPVGLRLKSRVEGDSDDARSVRTRASPEILSRNNSRHAGARNKPQLSLFPVKPDPLDADGKRERLRTGLAGFWKTSAAFASF